MTASFSQQRPIFDLISSVWNANNSGLFCKSQSNLHSLTPGGSLASRPPLGGGVFAPFDQPLAPRLTALGTGSVANGQSTGL
jgi:hypothetical protein